MEHTKDFTIDDWQKLWQEFAEEFDRQTIHDGKGRTLSSPTNILGSKATVRLHKESDSGIPHLHALVCRVDEEGNINNDHQIHLRAQRAAETVAKRRGWTTANQIRISTIQQVNEACMEVLRAMPQWSFNEYFQRLYGKGYYVKSQIDKQGVVKGYTLVSKKNPNVRYKASDLGTGRNLTASRIEKTWQRLHQPSVAISPQQTGPSVQQPTQQRPKQQAANRTRRRPLQRTTPNGSPSDPRSSSRLETSPSPVISPTMLSVSSRMLLIVVKSSTGSRSPIWRWHSSPCSLFLIYLRQVAEVAVRQTKDGEETRMRTKRNGLVVVRKQPSRHWAESLRKV